MFARGGKPVGVEFPSPFVYPVSNKSLEDWEKELTFCSNNLGARGCGADFEGLHAGGHTVAGPVNEKNGAQGSTRIRWQNQGGSYLEECAPSPSVQKPIIRQHSDNSRN